jgi:putative Ca2+/H+ antiporter (TMEM165/GDT1 family)
MQTLFLSTVAVAIAEIGDKTQLLSLVLAARYRKPLPICVGILVATLLNHALAGALGAFFATWLGPQLLKWIVAVSFFAIGLWTLVPDKASEDAMPSSRSVLLANVPVVWFGARFADRLPLRAARIGAALLVIALAIWIALGLGMGNGE